MPSNLFAWAIATALLVLAFEFGAPEMSDRHALALGAVGATVAVALLLLAANDAPPAQLVAVLFMENAIALFESLLPEPWPLPVHLALSVIYLLTVGVGAWLIGQGFDPNGLPQGRETGRGETPLAALVRFAAEAPDSSRFAQFLRLLLAHGAEIEALSPATRRTALGTAVDAYAPTAFEALRTAGASEATLTSEDRVRLAQMRASPPPARSLHADGPDCVR